jgi:Rieske 2Fe-2S family protein
VCLGRARELVGAPGDQAAVATGSGSVLLARDDAGSLRAFANVCRHRGHELLACGTTTTRRVVQCPYHAWSYELDGRLRIAPRFEGTANFVPEEMGLVPVGVAERHGWVWVNVTGTAPAFDDHHAGLAEVLSPWPLDGLVVAITHRYELAANWKLVHENYQECYHCPLIHPELCRLSDPLSGDNVEAGDRPWVAGAMTLSDGAATMADGGVAVGPMLPGLPAAWERRVLYVSVLPNLLVAPHPDYVLTHRLTPLAPDCTEVECQWLVPAGGAADGIGRAVEFWDLTNRQDWAAVESVQRSMVSPGYVPGVLAPMEDAVHRVVRWLAARYAGDPHR